MNHEASLDVKLGSLASRRTLDSSVEVPATTAPPRVLVLAVMVLPFAVLAAGLVAGVVGNGWYTWLVREDGPLEILQVLALVTAAAGASVLARRAADAGRKRRAVVSAGLALLLLFVAGEEISWGQRLFGWQTPETLASINRQQETNLHNIFGIETMFRLGMIGLLLFGGLVPLVTGRGVMAEVPRALLAPYVVLPVLGQVFGRLYSPPARYQYAMAESSEFMEFIVYFGLLLAIGLHLRASQRRGRGTTASS